MAKGKGNKLMAVSKNSKVIFAAVCRMDQSLTINSARKKSVLKPGDWKAYIGEMGSRGQKLSKGSENIQGLSVN